MINLTIILSILSLAFGQFNHSQYKDSIVVGKRAPDTGYDGYHEEHVYDLKDYFKSLSKNLSDDSNKKHFETVGVDFITKNGTLEENSFADIIMNFLNVDGITNINSNAFGKAAETIDRFSCEDCQIENAPPKYDVWQALSTLKSGIMGFMPLEVIIGVNVTEIPSNAIEPDDAKDSIHRLKFIVKNQSLTVKSEAFSKLTSFTEICFTSSHLKKGHHFMNMLHQIFQLIILRNSHH